MPPILVIDGDDPTRAARAALQREGAVGRTSPREAADAPGATRYDTIIADTCMQDADGAARVHALAQGMPTARLVARSRAGVMAAIGDGPDFPAMALRLAAQ